MSLSKLSKALRELEPKADELAKLVKGEGERSDKENARIKALFADIIANWDVVTQYQDAIEKMAEHGARTDAEESLCKGLAKRLTKTAGTLWKSHGVEEQVVPASQQKVMSRIRAEMKRFAKQLSGVKRTASAAPADGMGTKKQEQGKARTAPRGLA